MEAIFFKSSAELREWLEENHDTARELQVGFYKKKATENGISYPEAVDEALCYGWIDGIRKSIDEDRYMNRFTPRKKRSIWSAVNIKRVGELIEMGRMQPSGLAEFEGRDPSRAGLYSFEEGDRELSDEYKVQFQANEEAWGYFEAQSPSYQRTASWWVMSAKREETRQKRLGILIDDSSNKRRTAAVTYSPAQYKPKV